MYSQTVQNVADVLSLVILINVSSTYKRDCCLPRMFVDRGHQRVRWNMRRKFTHSKNSPVAVKPRDT